jgi:hypothetical protein
MSVARVPLSASPLEHKAIAGGQRYLGRGLLSFPGESVSQPLSVLTARMLQAKTLNLERSHLEALELSRG